MNNFQFTKETEAGQSLFELVVAIAISAIIITALVSLVSNSIRNSTFSKNKALAATYSQQATEWLRGQRDNDINTFETNALIPTWCLTGLDWSVPRPCVCQNAPIPCSDDSDTIPGTPFSRQVTFTIDASSGKTIVEVNVQVFWDDSQGRHTVASVTDLSDWRQR